MHVDYDEEFPAMSYEHYVWLCEMGDKILDVEFLKEEKNDKRESIYISKW